MAVLQLTASSIRRLKDELRPDVKLAILFNSTTVYLPQVRDALCLRQGWRECRLRSRSALLEKSKGAQDFRKVKVRKQLPITFGRREYGQDARCGQDQTCTRSRMDGG